MSTDFLFRDAAAGDEAAIRHVVFSVLEEYGLAPDPSRTDADLENPAASYGARGGCFRLVVSPSGAVVGCGGLYPLSDGGCEIRKMYLLPEARGRGFGRALLEYLIEQAKGRGYPYVVVETASPLKEAISLYRKRGFVPYERRELSCRCDQAFVLPLAGAPPG